jgi:hypothetical protein
MPRPVSTGLNTVKRRRADGTVTTTWYHRRTGILIGRDVDGMTLDQAIERARTIAAEPLQSGPKPGSFGELAMLYLGGPGFKKLAPRTQGEYRDHISILRGMWEDVPLAGITKKAVVVMHQQYADRPYRGNAILRTLRIVLNYGRHDLELADLADRNPADRLELHGTEPRNQVWPQAKIDAFLQAATACGMPRLRKALALLLYTGQRASDVLDMATPMVWEAEGRTWIRLRQAKTDELLDVPCHRRLAEELAAEDPPARDRRKREASILLLPSPTGRRWTIRNFARAWDRVEARANLRLAREAIAARGGLPTRSQDRAAAKAAIRAQLIVGLQRRDLRRTSVVQMAAAGATVPQIAAITGWQIDYTQKIVDTYLPKRGEVALEAVERWENAKAPRVLQFARRRG